MVVLQAPRMHKIAAGTEFSRFPTSRTPGQTDLGHTLRLLVCSRLLAATSQSSQAPCNHDARTAVVCREAALEATSTPLMSRPPPLPLWQHGVLEAHAGASTADRLAC